MTSQPKKVVHSAKPRCLLPQPRVTVGTDGRGSVLSRNVPFDSCAREGEGEAALGGIVLGGGNCLFTKLPTNFRAAHLLSGLLSMGTGTGTAGSPGLSHGTFLGKVVPAAALCKAAGRARAVGLPTGMNVSGMERGNPGGPRTPTSSSLVGFCLRPVHPSHLPRGPGCCRAWQDVKSDVLWYVPVVAWAGDKGSRSRPGKQGWLQHCPRGPGEHPVLSSAPRPGPSPGVGMQPCFLPWPVPGRGQTKQQLLPGQSRARFRRAVRLGRLVG